jgi:hypothetical protein
MWASGTSGVTLGTSAAALFTAATDNSGKPAGVMWIRARSTNSINCNITATMVGSTSTAYVVLEAGDVIQFRNATLVQGYASATSGASLDLAEQRHWEGS